VKALMVTEDENLEQIETSWYIDLDWFQQNDRSFSLLAQNALCPKCRKKLKAEEREIPPDELITAIKGCCHKSNEFIYRELPILESVFRFLLANGNKPTELEELSRKLSERLEGDTYRTSPGILSRILKNDRFYGFREAESV